MANLVLAFEHADVTLSSYLDRQREEKSHSSMVLLKYICSGSVGMVYRSRRNM